MRSLIPAKKELYPSNNFSFTQHGAPSHSTKIIRNFLRGELKFRFVANMIWPPSSPDCNPLDYYFCNEVKENVHSGHDAKHFEGGKMLKDRIFSVYDQRATNVEPLRKARKQFLPRLKDFVKKKKKDRSRPCLAKLCSAIIKIYKKRIILH